MIARLWTGLVPKAKAGRYLELMEEVAIPDYRAIDGNQGAWRLSRDLGDLVEVRMLTFWRDMDAIRAFAGAMSRGRSTTTSTPTSWSIRRRPSTTSR